MEGRNKNIERINQGGIMKKFLSVYGILCLIIITYHPAMAQWEPCNNGLWGHRVNTITINGNDIWIGTWSGGVFLSTDDGKSWIPKNTGLDATNVNTIAVDGNHIYIGTWKGVYKSSDYGETWEFAGSPNGIIQSIIINGNNIIAGGEFAGVILSTDKGVSWTKKIYGLEKSQINCLANKGDTIFAGLYLGGIYCSTDNCENWNQVFSGLTESTYHSFAIDGDKVYAGSGGGGIFLTTNNGALWENIGLDDHVVFSIHAEGGSIWASTEDGTYLSTNNGINWERKGNWYDSQVRSVAISEDKIWAGTIFGMFLSSDSGNNWVGKNNGLNYSQVWAIKFNRENCWLGSDQGVFVSKKNEMEWKNLWSYFDTTTYKVAFTTVVEVIDNNIIVGTWENGLFFSNDNGESWKKTNISPNRINCIERDNDKIIAGTNKGIYITEDNGENWYAGTVNKEVHSIVFEQNNIFVGTAQNVLISIDNGNTWFETKNELEKARIYSLGIQGSNFYAGTHDGIYLSTDLCESWKKIGLDSNIIFSINIYKNHIFASTWKNGIFLSSDSGKTWTAINDGLINLLTRCIVSDEEFLYLGTYSDGVYRAKIDELITYVTENFRVSNIFSISPNPSHEFLSINIIQEFPYPTNIKIFNIHGQVVFTDEIPAGIKNFKINIEKLPSGMYFINAVNGQISETQKFTIIK